MKLRRIRVENFKRFRDPLAIDALVDGLNLFAAPNESGKSTVAEAICAAFFERHRSSSVEHLRSWGDSSATPTVELDFEIGPTRYRLTKAFLGRKRCSLTIDGAPPLDGAAAEDHLAGLLGFRFPGKGASGPEHMGLPGLLWVRQSTAHELADAVSHAADHLRQVLGESLGELASTSGDALLRKIESQRNELLTPNKGDPRGDYEAALKRQVELTESVEQLTQEITAYRASVDRLAEQRQAHARDEREQPWMAIERQLQDAQARLQAALNLESRRESAMQTLQQWSANVVSLQSQLAVYARDETAVATRAQAVATAASADAAAQAELTVREQRHQEAVVADARARKQLDRARMAAEREELAKSAADLEGSRDAIDITLTRARAERVRLTRLQTEAAELAIDADELKRLRQLSESLRDARVRLEAAATSLEFDLHDGCAIRIGDETITGRTRRTVARATHIELEGIGRIVVSPGGENLDRLASRRDSLSEELGRTLARMGVADVAAAEQRADQAVQRRQEAKAIQDLLDAVAPKGVEALEAELAGRSVRLAEVRSALAALPPPGDDHAEDGVPLRAAAQAEAERAHAARETAAQALSLAKVAAVKAQGDHGAARQELHAAQMALSDPHRAQRVAAGAQALSDARAQEAAAAQQVGLIEAELKAANLALLNQDIERLTRSARQMQADRKRRDDEIMRLEVELSTKGALGLEEQRAGVEREREAASRRAEELGRRAAALDYLVALLREKRSALARRLRAPLQKHLERYLQILFPGASIEVAEDLAPGPITRIGPRGEERGEFKALSLGTREQMGIIARLAYADLLQEAGRPTLLILDDALVHSDEARLGQMKRVLYDAATRHQMLIFTCHPAAWRDLGVVARPIGA